MRRMMAVLTGLTLLAGVGCTKQIQGSAEADPDAPLTQVSEDGYGLTAGFADAPVQIEIFAEPQCSHCADLQRAVGDDLAHYIGLGQLAVTYRPMTFLDTADFGYSARVSNALFVAASQRNARAVAFQAFVESLWTDQDPSGRGPDDDDIAEKASAAGLPEDVVGRIGRGETAVDAVEMDAANYDLLYLVDPMYTGTPTVYNLNTDETVDIYDADWLDKLMSSA